MDAMDNWALADGVYECELEDCVDADPSPFNVQALDNYRRGYDCRRAKEIDRQAGELAEQEDGSHLPGYTPHWNYTTYNTWLARLRAAERLNTRNHQKREAKARLEANRQPDGRFGNANQ